MTKTVCPRKSPDRRSARITACTAVRPGMPMQAPAAKSTPSGKATACAAGKAMYCAQVPMGRCHWPFHSHTRSPTREPGTPSPTASITPAPSLCGTISGSLTGRARRDLTSEGFTPELARRTSTSPACGLGVGKSPTCNTSWASPLRLYQAAFMKVLLEIKKIKAQRQPSHNSLQPVRNMPKRIRR